MAAARNALTVRRRLRRLRLETALTNPGTALSAGLIAVLAAVAYVLGQRAVLTEAAWAIGLAVGGGMVALKVVADLIDRDDEPDLLRRAIAGALGDSIANDPELTRLARQAIEHRARLSQAQARAPRTTARALDPVLADVDVLIDRLVVLARQASRLRADARFQSGMATLARQRLTHIEARGVVAGEEGIARDLRETAGGLAAQLTASGDFTLHVEALMLRLDRGVSALGAVSARLMLALSQDDLGPMGVERTRIAAARDDIDAILALPGAPPPAA